MCVDMFIYFVKTYHIKCRLLFKLAYILNLLNVQLILYYKSTYVKPIYGYQ